MFVELIYWQGSNSIVLKKAYLAEEDSNQIYRYNLINNLIIREIHIDAS
jgi:hypothetical protein